ncbi:MAG: hypothetical protein K940chlam8_01218 [Chlamydiae bacterium]|nr:hypothetical protein [Chlamydiota bacterium]
MASSSHLDPSPLNLGGSDTKEVTYKGEEVEAFLDRLPPIANSAHPPQTSSSSSSEPSLTVRDSDPEELSLDSFEELGAPMKRIDLIEPRTLQSKAQKASSYVSSFFGSKKPESKKAVGMYSPEKGKVYPSEEDKFKDIVLQNVQGALEDNFTGKYILDTSKETQNLEASWKDISRSMKKIPDPVPMAPGRKPGPMLSIPESVWKDLRRSGIPLEIDGVIYQNPFDTKTTEQLFEENKEYSYLFIPDEETEDADRMTVKDERGDFEIDKKKFGDFVADKHVYETMRKLGEKYGPKAAQIIIFGAGQGNLTRANGLMATTTMAIGMTWQTADDQIPPLRSEPFNRAQVEVKRNAMGQIRKFRFKFTSGTQYFRPGSTTPEMEVMIKEQYHVYNGSLKYKFANYVLEEIYAQHK